MAIDTNREKYTQKLLDRAIPISDEQFNLNSNLYLTENSDSWFKLRLDSMLISTQQPSGIPISIKSKIFASKMGHRIGTNLLEKLNAGGCNYLIHSYDVMEMLYYCNQSKNNFKQIEPVFYDETVKLDQNYILTVQSQYVIYRESKAWGVLISMNTLHKGNNMILIDYGIEGKIFQDRMNKLD